jgi:hypothetical protein
LAIAAESVGTPWEGVAASGETDGPGASCIFWRNASRALACAAVSDALTPPPTAQSKAPQIKERENEIRMPV